MGNKAREINSPVIKQLIDETTAEELAKIDTEMTNNKQQTAVDYIFSQLPAEYGTTRGAFDVYQQAKEMEKEQISKAFDDGDYNYHYSRKTGDDFEDGKEYFNEIYG
jgi:hypothetical protein